MNQPFYRVLVFLFALVWNCHALEVMPGSRSPFDFKFTTNVCGMVRDAAGAPVAGVQITFYPGGMYQGNEFGRAVTDKSGHYSVNAPKMRQVIFDGAINPFSAVVARDPNRNLAAAVIFDDGRTNVDLILHPALTISGTVRATNEMPIAGVEVMFRFRAGNCSAMLDMPPVKTDGQGKFTVAALPPGCGYDITGFRAKGYGSRWITIKAEDTQTNRYQLPLILLKQTDRKLAGKVVDTHGKPVFAATVSLGGQDQPTGTNGDFGLTAVTDVHGNFSFNEVCAGKVQVTANKFVQDTTGTSFLSSAIGPESIFPAGDTNVLVKVEDMEFKNSGLTLLHRAARDGNLEASTLLVAKTANLNAGDVMGDTPLHLAAKNGYTNIVKLLLANRAIPNAANNMGETPLHLATMNGHVEVAKVLLAHGSVVDSRDKQGVTPLHKTAVDGRKDAAELLLANKADVNAKADNGFTALHWAALHGHKDVAEVLLANGAEVNAMNNHGDTPLHWALQNRQTDVADLLRKHGGLENGYSAGKPANAPANWNTSAFRGALQSGDVNEVEKLLKENASLINSKDEQKRTPLILAAMANRGPVVELLLSHKADINAEDIFGRTALDWTALVGAKDAAQVLADHQADVNAKAEGGATPLHFAARNGFQGIAEVLVAHGADVNATDDKGNTPLHWVEAELRAGPPAEEGTPRARIYAANLKGRKDVAEWLRQHGGHE